MEVMPGYKRTEIAVIPDDWELVSLGEKTEKVGSGITPTGGARVYKSDGRPFIRSQNVGWGKLILDDVAFIDEQTHCSFSNTEIKNNDVLLNITGASIGRSAISDNRITGGNVNQHVCIIRPDKEGLDSQYLNAFLLSHIGQGQIDSFQAGGNRQGLNFGQIKSIQIIVPPLTEQRTIATALSDVDALIRSLDQLIAKKRDLKQAAMQQLLSGKRRLPGFSGEWETKRLSEVADIQRGASPRPIDSPEWYDANSKVGWVRISDVSVSDGKFLSETRDCLSERGITNSRYLPSGSLIMSICATVGIPVITKIDACIHDGFVGFTRLRKVEQTFLYYVLKDLEPVFKSLGQTGSQNNLNSDLVRLYNIGVPSLSEQVAIAAVLSDMDAELAGLGQRREKTRAVKAGMMQVLLTGRVRLV